MCGIAGLFDPAFQYASEARIKIVSQFNALQSHRGPDAKGIWEDENSGLVLGHTRLSIIDLDSRSNQPMESVRQRYVISFNGEIYNYREIRKELIALGAAFKTDSDTEVFLEGYARWGDAIFQKVDGMFAVAIYDKEKGELLLARDRAGEKPLFYCVKNGGFAFSSELKALSTLPSLSRNVSVDALYHYFSLRYVPDPDTIFEELKSVSPGTLVRINSKMELRERSLYAFDIEGRKARESIDVNVFLEELESRLIRSISRRLHADVSVGAYLSSGVDSSLVCAISAKKLGLDPKCFSAGFTNVSDNETIVAEKIANHLGLPFEAYYISQDDLLTAVTQFGKNLDEPNGDRSCVPTYFLSALISSQVRVAVSGDGGDELFGGYGRYQDLNHQLSPKKMIQSYFNERLPMFPANVLEQVLPHSAEVFRKKFVSRYLSAFERTDLLDIERMRLMDFYSYLPGAVLAKVDRMSMKNSLEVRTPFLDPAILEMSTFLPATLIHQEGLLKMALRKILAKYLPAELILPNKQGFGMPASFFNSYASVFNRLLTQADETLAAWSGFDFDRSAFTTLQQASRNSINTIWCWISLAQWSESLPAVTRLGKSEGVAV